MRRTNEICRVKPVMGSLISMGIMVLLPMAVCGSGTQEKQEVSAGTVTAAAQLKNTSRTEPKAGEAVLQQRSFRYELQPGDIFDVAFPFTPEFNQTVTIQPDGYIALTALGNLQVAGKTVPEVSELLRTGYAKILHDPVVNIVLKDFQKPYFIASGELSHPGKYELRSDTTLTEAIAIAGGFTEDSKHSEVFLFRRESNNWVEIKKIDVKRMYKEADLREDMHLQPGDMVFVPQNRYSKFKRYIPSPGLGMTVTPAP